MFSTLFMVMVGALGVLLLFQGLIFARLAFGKVRVEPVRDLPVSLVICARNEARALEQLIPLMMEQDHGDFEVVVVNDRSEDDTWEILQWMKPQYPRLRPVNIQADEKFSYGKKIALGVGVRTARFPHVLLTDADCRPAGRDWISCMASGFAKGRKIVLGYSPYRHLPGLTNLLERYDGISKALQYLAFARAGLPYMGVGRNLGYAQEVFFARGGSRRHNHLMSGDDDLFINEVARANNTNVVLDPRAWMPTEATRGLATWLRRKRRHYTTARYYRFGHQVLLTLLPLARFVFWAAFLALLLGGHHREAAIGAAVKLGVFTPITMLCMHRLHGGSLVWLALPMEWLFLLLDPLIYLSTLIIKPRIWK